MVDLGDKYTHPSYKEIVHISALVIGDWESESTYRCHVGISIFTVYRLRLDLKKIISI